MRKNGRWVSPVTEIVDVYFGPQYAKGFDLPTPLRCELLGTTSRSVHLQYKVNNKPVKRWFPVVAILKQERVEISVNIKSVRRTQFTQKEPEKIQLKGIRGELKPYQKEGVGLLKAFGGNAILADEMGLGKTLQAIAYIFHEELYPAIIVCPASLKDNWAAEFRKWVGLRRCYIAGSQTPVPVQELHNHEIVIINYDILKHWVAVLKKLKPQILVCDEAHYIKTGKAQRAKAVQLLKKTIPKTILLTGTPFENTPIEIFNLVKLVNPTLFKSRVEFGVTYCNGQRGDYGWEFKGSSNEKELHDILYNSVMIRRLKQDVAKELPEKQYNEVVLPLSNSEEYRKAQTNFLTYVKETKGASAAKSAARAATLSQMATLRRLAASGGVKAACEWIDNFLEGSTEKLVVFGIHKELLKTLQERYQNQCVVINGDVPPTLRQGIVDKFQTDPTIRLFFGNIKAAGVGLTLTAAYSIAFLELPWHPGQLNQAIDRVHRIGQTRGVMIYFLFAKNTILQKMAGMLLTKGKIADAVLDGAKIPEGVHSSIVTDLVNYYQNKS